MTGAAETTGRVSPARTTGEGLLALAVGLGVGGYLVRAATLIGSDLLSAAGADPYDAAMDRALELAFATLALIIARSPLERFPSALLAGLAAGFGSHLLLDPVDGFFGAPRAWLALAFAAAISCRLLGYADPTPRPTPSRRMHLGVTAATAGITIQVTGLWRIAGRLGLGTPEDDAVFAAVLVALIALGGVTFGRMAARSSSAHVAAACGAAAIAGLLALPIAAAVAMPLGFKALCARFGADASLAGTLRVDTAVALTVFVLPALACGALLHIVRRRSLFVALAFGIVGGRLAALGLLSAGLITEAGVPSLTNWSGAGAAGLVTKGTLVAGLGVALLGLQDARRWQRSALITGGLVLAVLGWLLPVTFVPVFDPWERFPVSPRLIVETADGQFAIEPAGGNLERVTLDQRPLSPRANELEADRARILWSLASRERLTPAIRVLVVGLVTPQRMRAFREGGVVEIDRTAGWWGSMEAVERALFGGAERPGGSILSLTAARSGIAKGDYNLILVLAPGSSGRSIDRGLLDVAQTRHSILPPPRCDAIAWMNSERPIAHLDWTEQIAIASDGIEHWSVALVTAVPPPDGSAGLRAAGPPSDAPSILEWLAVRPDERGRRAWRDAAARIAAADGAGAFERAVTAQAAAQRISSPFESPAQRVELDPTALSLWRDGAVAAEILAPLERGVIEGVARVIEGQRAVALAYSILEPIAEAHAPWPALIRTLAWADGEELEFADAVARLEPLSAADPADVVTASCHAHALVQAGRGTDAVALLRPHATAESTDGALGRALRTQFADALVAAGDPEGRRLATELLREDPGNALLFGLARGMRGGSTAPVHGDAVIGQIEARSVRSVDAGDGAPIYFTTLRISGTDLATGAPAVEDVLFVGGFVDDLRGSFNASAPAAVDTRVGRHVLAFTTHTTNIVGGFSGNLLTGSGAGLFTTFESRSGATIVQGRGPGHAVVHNVTLTDLRASLR